MAREVQGLTYFAARPNHSPKHALLFGRQFWLRTPAVKDFLHWKVRKRRTRTQLLAEGGTQHIIRSAPIVYMIGILNGARTADFA